MVAHAWKCNDKWRGENSDLCFWLFYRPPSIYIFIYYIYSIYRWNALCGVNFNNLLFTDVKIIFDAWSAWTLVSTSCNFVKLPEDWRISSKQKVPLERRIQLCVTKINESSYCSILITIIKTNSLSLFLNIQLHIANN